jgi:hypothetical protein
LAFYDYNLEGIIQVILVWTIKENNIKGVFFYQTNEIKDGVDIGDSSGILTNDSTSFAPVDKSDDSDICVDLVRGIEYI